MGKIIFAFLLPILFLPRTTAAGENWENYGDRFFNDGEYYRAITMYHLGIFDATKSSDLCRLYVKSAEAYIKAGYFEYALGEYDRAGDFCDTDYLFYLRGRLFFLNGRYEMAVTLWKKIQETFIEVKPWIYFAQILDLNPLGTVELDRYASSVTNASKRRLLKKIAGVNLNIHERSPLIAGILSAILPGAGQIYTAHYGEASLSLVVNSIFFFLTYQAVRKAQVIPHYGYSEAGFWGFIAAGFYLGNIYGAALSAKRYNYYQKARFRRDFLNNVRAAGFSLKMNF